MKALNQALGLATFLLLSFATAALGSVASINAAGFYAELQQPAWAPPGWLFGPVWTVLFLLMAVAGWLVWRRLGVAGAPLALGLFLAQLVANALWSWLFFAWRLGGPAFVEVLVLWALVAATFWVFWRLQRLAAVLLLPYLVWVGFAAVLNFTLWRMNPGLLG